MSVHNHSTFVPADNMIASIPQWIVRVSPSSEKATMGNVPNSVRFASVGPTKPVYMSSMPPVPKVIFVAPGVMHPCPTSDDCWSPMRAASAMPSSGGQPSTRPTISRDATIVGRHSTGMPKIAQTWGSQSTADTSTSPVTAAFV